ncbi:MAG: hypothetical protein H6581_19965 [Bacteroidia bacterium]|nr:hypothetical protein [Bacteroidia bacterium]
MNKLEKSKRNLPQIQDEPSHREVVTFTATKSLDLFIVAAFTGAYYGYFLAKNLRAALQEAVKAVGKSYLEAMKKGDKDDWFIKVFLTVMMGIGLYYTGHVWVSLYAIEMICQVSIVILVKRALKDTWNGEKVEWKDVNARFLKALGDFAISMTLFGTHITGNLSEGLSLMLEKAIIHSIRRKSMIPTRHRRNQGRRVWQVMRRGTSLFLLSGMWFASSITRDVSKYILRGITPFIRN